MSDAPDNPLSATPEGQRPEDYDPAEDPCSACSHPRCQLERLNRENAALRAECDRRFELNKKLFTENSALRADRDRLAAENAAAEAWSDFRDEPLTATCYTCGGVVELVRPGKYQRVRGCDCKTPRPMRVWKQGLKEEK